jgi:glycyl-tRNA synthetase
MDIDKIIDIAKRRGFVFHSAEIYGGLSGFFDYGPLGCIMKNKIEDFWREFFVRSEGMWEISSRTIVPEAVWNATNHLKDFVDPITQCQNCKSMYRADSLIEEKTGKFVEGSDPAELTKIIQTNKIVCPKCKGKLGEVRVFNLMLKTNVGPVEGDVAYLRPETAQGIFTNFKNIVNTTRAKLPFGVAQVGISYRNEISPRQWIMRLREFNQMEVEMFIHPKKINECPKFSEVAKKRLRIVTRETQKGDGKAVEVTAEEAVKKGIVPNQWQAYFMVKELEWYQQLGIPLKALRHRHMLPEETPHYSKGNFDMEIEFDFGWKEVVGNAYRTDFDLQTHMKHSGKDLSIVEDGVKIVPHVIEPSFGMERTLYAVLLYCFVEDKKRGWDWFRFPPRIAPFIAAVYPLVNKDGIPEKAREVFFSLLQGFDVFYDESGSIGKRYARADEIGTPWCITVDYDSLKNNDVTIRDRDSTKQIRVKIQDLNNVLKRLMNQEVGFEK